MHPLRVPSRPRPPQPADDWALFLDVDGCLLEFAATPDGVIVPPSLRDALAYWSARLDGALALVSGRSLSVLDGLFSPLRLPAAGLHGLERRLGDARALAPGVPPALRSVHEAAERIAADHAGAVIEDKGAALALHWRQAPAAEAALRAFALSALPSLPGYRLQAGDQVLELRPDGADKGSAIEAFLAQPPFQGRLPVFAGDDLTDEHGFAVVNARGGHSVLVGDRDGSVARFHLPDPSAVRAWLGGHGGSP